MLSMAQGSGLVGETQWPVFCGKVTIEDPEVLSELKVLKLFFIHEEKWALAALLAAIQKISTKLPCPNAVYCWGT